ncbi:hypothetical protein [Sphingobacterium bambusae]|uniref:Uncharacterized protein n=1 Tax=Sphingobacterium bambusae TaxID=662858 RepID=A0ABW6BC49_9SPHI|nr:hypothetical protein [Sphingobacterium bambusae]WPL47213.1 hypothetical protein SCB77_14700 [Sphingobacterium bambusae]
MARTVFKSTGATGLLRYAARILLKMSRDEDLFIRAFTRYRCRRDGQCSEFLKRGCR